MTTLVRPEHASKEPFPMLVTLSGMAMRERAVQPRKAWSLMLTTPLPIVAEARLTHDSKAPIPISTGLFPRETLVRPEAEKAKSPMVARVAGNATPVRFLQVRKALDRIVVTP